MDLLIRLREWGRRRGRPISDPDPADLCWKRSAADLIQRATSRAGSSRFWMSVKKATTQGRCGQSHSLSACDGWIDVSDLGCVMDHTGPLPHPAIDQLQ